MIYQLHLARLEGEEEGGLIGGLVFDFAKT